MTDSNNLPPDRLSIHPFSEYFDQDALSRGIGIRFKGEQKTTVEEYCISEGWVRIPTGGKSRDRYGNPMMVKVKGTVEVFYVEG